MRKELEKTYSPASFEDRIYKMWEDGGYFKPSDDRTKTPFSIVIPPPNVTGQLHMGHALNNTLQDILIRTKRMQGYNALWIPGTDHAGIATQIKVEAVLRQEKGLTRHDIGREEFLKLVWDWKEKYGSRIISQLKKLGSSCDWEHECFTMNENLSDAVRKTFVSLYNKGLIYRGLRIINWCPSCATALSDAEIEHKELEGAFWHIAYPVKDSDERLIIATTRPETLLGDTAVAVHPDDERYRHLVGKTLILPLVGREIPVIADEYVDREFGTGCVKITPAHDPNDFEVGQRHNLEVINIFDDKAAVNENGGKYQGMDRYVARKAIVADLEEQGFLIKIVKHAHNVGHCYRCGNVVEPIASKQWFVRMKPLAAPAIDVVKRGEIRFIPERFSKNYLNWMENIHDWCVSRQLWWGHRIPAFYCDACGEMTVSDEVLTTCPHCGCKVHQDEDVLDTWFSSALWPFSTLGWPHDNEELRYFYPTGVLVTAYDIITFWVSKMIFMGIENTHSIPFPKVFIHGLVRDEQGRKMSKSLGNGIDPLEVISQYGADALRFALATGNSPGNDMRFSQKKVEAARNFNNKLWNAARFILMNLHIDRVELPPVEALEPEDKWILSRFNDLAGEVCDNIERYEIGVALDKIYDFVWDIFCDWYIEMAKTKLFAGNETAQNVIAYVFIEILKLLHPFLPFITEEIWQSMPHEGDTIMTQTYPKYDPSLSFPQDVRNMDAVIAVIRAVRQRRTDMNVPMSRKTRIYLNAADPAVFADAEPFFVKLAGASALDFDACPDANAVQIVTDAATAFIPMSELVDPEKERARLQKEKEKTEEDIRRIEAKLSNEGFVSKAPAAVVNAEREKLEKFRDLLSGIQSALELL